MQVQTYADWSEHVVESHLLRVQQVAQPKTSESPEHEYMQVMHPH
jgi:hypothetical protein